MPAAPCVQRALTVLRDAGYVPDGGVALRGRPGHPVLALRSPGGSAVVAKLYPDGNGRATFDRMEALWASSFGERRNPLCVPRALAYVAEIGALIMERVDGRPLGGLGLGDDRSIVAAMELLVTLHELDARPPDRRTARGVVRSLRRRAERVGQVAPACAAPFFSVVEALEDSRPRPVTPVPSHGDFCPRNLLVCPDRMVLIDWDRFRWADPARDVASFGAWSWGRAVRDGQAADWSVLEKATAVYGRLHPRGAAALDDGVPFYAAAALVRTCHILVTRPRQAGLVPRFLAEAQRLLS